MLPLVSLALVCVGLYSVVGTCAAGQTYYGRLDYSVHVDSSSGSLLLFSTAPEALFKALSLDPERVSSLYRGEISLGAKPAL